MLLFNKVLPLLVSPLGLFLIWTVLALLLRRARWIWPALALLWLAATPVVSHWAVRAVEEQAVLRNASDMPQADAIVVLSGMVRTVPGEGGALQREWQDGVDRFEGGLALWQAHRAPRLLITAGQQPWDVLTETEGHWLRAQAIGRGVPPASVELTPPVDNTVAEASAVRQMLGRRTVLLVTSAFHMPRARAAFEAAGLTVIPYPVDLRAGERASSVQDYLPEAGALAGTSLAVREWVGRAFYGLRRLISPPAQGDHPAPDTPAGGQPPRG